MFSKGRFWFLLSGLAALTVLLAACAAQPTVPPEPTEVAATPTAEPTEIRATATPEEVGPVYGGVLRIGVTSDWGSLDPWTIFIGNAKTVMRMISNSLTEIAQDGTIQLEAAKEVNISDDGLVYTFKLHPMKFHNGREVTAEDWIYSFTRHLDPDVGSLYSYLLEVIAGAAEYQAGEADSVEGLKAVDDDTLQITLAEANAMFLASLAMEELNVVPKEVVEADPQAFSSHPVYTGPFMVDEYIHEKKISLVKNPNYWKEGLPYLDGVEIIFGVDTRLGLLQVEKGELDWQIDVAGGGNIPPAELDRVLNDPVLKDWVYSATESNVGLLFINGSLSVLDNVKVRQAIAWALDYERMALLTHGRPANYIWNPSKWVYDADYPGYTYNPEKAKELLAEAGYANGEGLPDEEWYMLANEASPWREVAEIIAHNLADVGIDVEIRIVPLSAIGDAWARDDIPLMLDQNTDFAPDPHDMAQYMTCAQVPVGYYNPGRVCDPQWDEWIKLALQSPDTDERKALYQKLGDAVMESATWVPLWYMSNYVIHSPKIGGFYLPEGFVFKGSIEEWYLMQ